MYFAWIKAALAGTLTQISYVAQVIRKMDTGSFWILEQVGGAKGALALGETDWAQCRPKRRWCRPRGSLSLIPTSGGRYVTPCCSAPNLTHCVHDEFQLGPLLILGQQVALRRRSEPALRT